MQIYRYNGKLKQYNKFDASFFGMNKCEGNASDVILRHLLELAHEAVLDAGKLACNCMQIIKILKLCFDVA